jgi:hypothetical protein
MTERSDQVGRPPSREIRSGVEWVRVPPGETDRSDDTAATISVLAAVERLAVDVQSLARGHRVTLNAAATPTEAPTPEPPPPPPAPPAGRASLHDSPLVELFRATGDSPGPEAAAPATEPAPGQREKQREKQAKKANKQAKKKGKKSKKG